MSALEPDHHQIAQFVDAVFRHVDPETYAAIRFYPDDKSGRVWRNDLWSYPALDTLVDIVARLARVCANAPLPIVFCPPLATFKQPGNARDDNVTDAPCLSVDCDTNPSVARAVLEARLGPATVVVASGGDWVDPAKGEIDQKVHCHWRLSAPARDSDHDWLKRARRRAMQLIDGDATGVPLSHPYRWPGSWHRKVFDRPKLARIVDIADVDIDLNWALAQLPEVDGECEEIVGTPATCIELSPYGAAALRSAAERIVTASNGKQELTLNGQSYAIGRLAGAGGVPVELALKVLLTVANGLEDYDRARPWQTGQAEKKVRKAFAAGMAKPRPDLMEIGIETLNNDWLPSAGEMAEIDATMEAGDVR